MENGREFRMEHRSKKLSRFIFCVVSSVEAKRFALCFPERSGLPLFVLGRGGGVWSVLAEKLCHLGVGSSNEAGFPPSPVNYRSVEAGVSSKVGMKDLYIDAVRKAHGRVGEAIWI